MCAEPSPDIPSRSAAMMPSSFTSAAPLLHSVPNFRDLGGHRARDGRCLAHQRIYRSQAFTDATAEDRAVLHRLDIRLVCDLRSAPERRHAPNAWAPQHSPALLELAVATDIRANPLEFIQALRSDPRPHKVHDSMLANYRSMPQAFASILPVLFERLLDEGNFPLVFHCTAGKDRTGFLAAMILLALEVPLPAVMDDYVATARLIDTAALAQRFQLLLERMAGFTLDTRALQPILETRPEYLEAALASIDADYGSVENYLRRCGLDDPRRADLQQMLMSG